MDLGVGVKF
jgi:hypothetical protein